MPIISDIYLPPQKATPQQSPTRRKGHSLHQTKAVPFDLTSQLWFFNCWWELAACYSCNHFRMSRQFRAEDLQAIHRLRSTLEESEHLSTCCTLQEADPTHDEGPADSADILLQQNPISTLRIVRAQNVPSLQEKEHTIYLVEVETGSMQWEVNRRYSEFSTLHQTVKKHAKVKSEFPKKVYNPFVSSTHPSVVEQRTLKLNAFLKEVAEIVKVARHPLLSHSFAKFIKLQENYDEQRWGQIVKSVSANAYSSPLATLKTLSEGSLAYSAPSNVQSHIRQINDPLTCQMALKSMEEYLKEKRGRLSNDEIKMTVLGSGNYTGLLPFGLSHPNQLRRIKALSILVDQVTAQNNYFWEKWTRVIERVGVEAWVVTNMSHFDSPGFKLLYFELIRWVWEWASKEKQEQQLLKTLFTFHVQLHQDFLQWWELKKGKEGPPSPTTAISQQQRRLTQVTHEGSVILVSSDGSVPVYQSQNVEAHINSLQKSIVLQIKSDLPVELKQQKIATWSGMVESSHKDDYINLTRTVIGIGKLKYHLRCTPLSANNLPKVLKNLQTMLPHSQYSTVSEGGGVWVVKEQCSVGIQPQYTEYSHLTKQRILVITLVGDELLQQTSGLAALAKSMAEDASQAFLPPSQ